MTQLLALFKTK